VNVEPGIWNKLTRMAVCLIFAAGVLLIAMWYLPEIKKNERFRKRLLLLDTLIQKEEETARQYKTDIEALRKDPKAVERLARERLGYAKPGETVIRFEAASTNSASTQ